MDADVGMSELDLIYMKGSKAHSGFPEVNALVGLVHSSPGKLYVRIKLAAFTHLSNVYAAAACILLTYRLHAFIRPSGLSEN